MDVKAYDLKYQCLQFFLYNNCGDKDCIYSHSKQCLPEWITTATSFEDHQTLKAICLKLYENASFDPMILTCYAEYLSLIEEDYTTAEQYYLTSVYFLDFFYENKSNTLQTEKFIDKKKSKLHNNYNSKICYNITIDSIQRISHKIYFLCAKFYHHIVNDQFTALSYYHKAIRLFEKIASKFKLNEQDILSTKMEYLQCIANSYTTKHNNLGLQYRLRGLSVLKFLGRMDADLICLFHLQRAKLQLEYSCFPGMKMEVDCSYNVYGKSELPLMSFESNMNSIKHLLQNSTTKQLITGARQDLLNVIINGKYLYQNDRDKYNTIQTMLKTLQNISKLSKKYENNVLGDDDSDDRDDRHNIRKDLSKTIVNIIDEYLENLLDTYQYGLCFQKCLQIMEFHLFPRVKYIQINGMNDNVSSNNDVDKLGIKYIDTFGNLSNLNEFEQLIEYWCQCCIKDVSLLYRRMSSSIKLFENLMLKSVICLFELEMDRQCLIMFKNVLLLLNKTNQETSDNIINKIITDKRYQEIFELLYQTDETFDQYCTWKPQSAKNVYAIKCNRIGNQRDAIKYAQMTAKVIAREIKDVV